MGKFARWSAPEGLSLLAAWTRAGCSAGEIARRCGVREAVLLGWAQRCPGVEAALRTTGEMADAQVENALLRRALGLPLYRGHGGRKRQWRQAPRNA